MSKAEVHIESMEEGKYSIKVRNNNEQKRRIVRIVLIALVFSSWVLFFGMFWVYIMFNRYGVYEHAAVSTEVQVCSNIGMRIMLNHNGNAIDAAIASALCVGLVNSFASGIGGGGFMLIRWPNDTSKVIDFRERAPLAVDPALYETNSSIVESGPHSIAVPGAIHGFYTAHKLGGRIPWADLFQDVINLANTGFQATPTLAKRIERFQKNISMDEGLSSMYLTKDHLPIQSGAILTNKNLANTMKLVADNGVDEFYKGSISKKIISFIKSKGGIMNATDLAEYKSIILDPLEGSYHRRRILSVPSPAGGAVAIQILNTLENYPYTIDIEHGSHNDAHIFVEALNFGFASRSLLQDPLVSSKRNITACDMKLVDKEFSKTIYENISSNSTKNDVNRYLDLVNGGDCKLDQGTSHINVIDSDGLCVSCTNTINYMFGSFLMDPDTGILFNNEMDDFTIPNRTNRFDIPPGRANFISPGARPMSSSIPMIIFERDNPKSVEYVMGGTGGSRIISSVLQTLLTLLSSDKISVRKAVKSSRIHSQLFGTLANGTGSIGPVHLEHDVSKDIIHQLEKSGHSIIRAPKDVYSTTVDVIKRHKDGWMEAYADTRKLGAGCSGY